MGNKAKPNRLHKYVNISENFWDEVQTRGFFVKSENGGKRFVDYDGYTIRRVTPEVFKMSRMPYEENIAFITPDLFMKTIRKIENMLNYKLFL